MAIKTVKPIHSKHLLIDQANKSIVIVTSVAAFVIIFSFVASKELFKQMDYQSKGITAKQSSLLKLQNDVSAENNLVTSYQSFIDSPNNIIGGSSTGNGANDGNNAQVILDALPSQYDFPALVTSMNALLSNQQGATIQSISGSDEVLSQPTSGSSTSSPVIMPFTVAVSGTYQGIQNVVNALQNSIRPLQIQTFSLTGNQSNLTSSIALQTYYQPAIKFNLSTVGIQ